MFSTPPGPRHSSRVDQQLKDASYAKPAVRSLLRATPLVLSPPSTRDCNPMRSPNPQPTDPDLRVSDGTNCHRLRLFSRGHGYRLAVGLEMEERKSLPRPSL